MAAVEVMPAADLLPRPGDIELKQDEFSKISLLARLAEATRKGFSKFPDTMRLRRCQRGEVICRQGEEGATAFYILTGEDLKCLRELILQRIPELGPEEAKEAALLRQNLADVAAALAQRPGDNLKEAQPFATVRLTTTARARPVVKTSWIDRLRWGFGRPRDNAADAQPISIPFDGPSDLDAATGTTTLKEGDLFGEMACRNRRPRSATVIALRDGFMLEFLGNILKKIEEDAAYRKEKDEVYKRRVLDLQLRYLSIFRELSDAEFAEVFAKIRPQIELAPYESGQIIFDENDRPDSIYLIRDGLVQVKKNASSLLAVTDVLNWPALWKTLRAETGVGAAMVRLFTPEAQAVCRSKEAPEEPPEDESWRQDLVYAVNDALKNRKFAEAAEFKETLVSASLVERAAGMPEDKKSWTEGDYRRYHRMLLEEALPKETLRRKPRYAGPDFVITYYSRGEFFGEMGVYRDTPRAASCIAYGQPRLDVDKKSLGSVELVRIPRKVFRDLLREFPVLRKSVKKEIEERLKRAARAEESRPKQTQGPGLFSTEAERLGLVQGQKLMLIDLERCTRCDECVRACVDTHKDGRSRLFLVGPRFGKFLVPTTCRACLDPVCMIGCPVRSIQRGDNREIIIKDWCIGCKVCAKQCPYESIQMHPLAPGEAPAEAPEGASVKEVTDRAVVCDLCSTLPSQDPACVYACPHEAAIRVDARNEFPAY